MTRNMNSEKNVVTVTPIQHHAVFGM